MTVKRSTVEKILLAALALMESKPAAAVTFREIAAQAGISHMAPYRHFKSRVEVFEKLAIEGHAVLASRLKEAIEKHPVDPEKQIIGAGFAYYDFSVEFPIHFRLMFLESLLDQREDKAQPLVEAAHSSFSVFLRMIYSAQMKKIISPKLPAKDVAFTLWSYVHGVTVVCQNSALQSMIGEMNTRKSIQSGIQTILRGA